jgi:hypothetical protein
MTALNAAACPVAVVKTPYSALCTHLEHWPLLPTRLGRERPSAAGCAARRAAAYVGEAGSAALGEEGDVVVVFAVGELARWIRVRSVDFGVDLGRSRGRVYPRGCSPALASHY